MGHISDAIIVLLQCYFLLMNFTVENSYCHSPFVEGDSRFLVKETIEFCEQHNRLFLLRPDWMVAATCASAYCLCIGYAMIAVTCITKSWRQFAVPILIFVGIKLNAILFYHYMEFTSSTPPENLGPYFSVEGPYLLSMLLVIIKVVNSLKEKTLKNN